MDSNFLTSIDNAAFEGLTSLNILSVYLDIGAVVKVDLLIISRSLSWNLLTWVYAYPLFALVSLNILFVIWTLF